MKKQLAILLVLALTLGLLAGCAGTPVVSSGEPSAAPTQAATETPATEAVPATEAAPVMVKTGLYVGTDISGSKSASAEEEGKAKYEWNEQAAAFAAYVTGKTAAEVAGIAVNEKSAPTDADLASTVTISIGDFLELIAKACA